jgi:hypothetical protein
MRNNPVSSLLTPNYENEYQQPQIPLKLSSRKLPITITWYILFTSSSVLPILLYFFLKDVAHLKTSVVLGVPTGISGSVSQVSYIQRLWSLVRSDSTTPPIGGSRCGLDYF